MKVTALRFRQLFLYTGLLSLLIPSVTIVSQASRGIAAPSASTSRSSTQAMANVGQFYQSDRLGLRVEVPSNYQVDKSQENQGVLVLRNRNAPPAIGSDQPASGSGDNGFVTGNQPQITAADRITVTEFNNSQRLSALQWAQRNTEKSFFNQREGDYRSYSFAGQPAVNYSWCSTNICGDSIVLPNRDRNRIVVLSALYDYPGNAVRWDFKNSIGQFRLTR